MKANIDYSDFVLSDVHITNSCESRPEQGALGKLSIARLRFKYAQDETIRSSNTISVENKEKEGCFIQDDDGDIVVARKCNSQEHEAVTIVHQMGSSLEHVGRQLWTGAFLLADYIIADNTRFLGKTCLELGGGIGLCSIIAGMFCSHVLCTDKESEILSLCQENIDSNSHLFGNGTQRIKVKEWDWSDPLGHAAAKSAFSWSAKDLKSLSEVDLVIASDVIYDDELTEAFFKTLSQLIASVRQKEVIILISLEKRLNFTLSEMTIVSPAYEYFLKKLTDFKSLKHGHECCRRVSINRIATTFPQSFEYTRSKELELWEMTVT